MCQTLDGCIEIADGLICELLNMLKNIRTDTKRLYEWWVGGAVHHPFVTLFLTFLVTAALLVYTLGHFRINTKMSDMISEKLPYRHLEREFDRAFPQFGDTILLVLDAPTPEAARSATEAMAARLAKEKSLFKRIYVPGGDAFFKTNGLLFLSAKELEDLSDTLANAQPLLGLISKDFSLRGLFSVTEKMVSQRDTGEKERLVPFFDGVARALESAATGRPYELSWQELVVGKEAAADMRRRFIILEPLAGDDELSDRQAAIDTVSRVRDELGLQTTGVTVRLTGDVVLDAENLDTVERGMGITTIVSFLLVTIALVVGFGSGRLVIANLVTLLVGLVWTLGFAIAAIGYLNLISVTFTVLFIGLGIDYGIQFCLRYREEMASGFGSHEALLRTARGTGVSLRLCTVAAAIGFYSFLPTAYVGVSELGLIAGTGMFINLFATLTVLPALLSVMPLKKGRMRKFTGGRIFHRIPYRHAKAIRIGAAVLGVGALFFLPKLSFDYNPLGLYNQRSEAVSTIRDLFKEGKNSPWTLSVLVGSEKEAQQVTARLKDLQEVKEVVSLADFVPSDQSEKLAILSDMILFMPPEFGDVKPARLSYEEKVASLTGLEKTLSRSIAGTSGVTGQDDTSLKRLSLSLRDFREGLDGPEKGGTKLDGLEKSLLSNLPVLLKELKTSLSARRVTEADLPGELRREYASPEGFYRVEVFPKGNLMEVRELKRFVRSVTAAAPNAIGVPVIIREAGKAVFESFIHATIYALLAITVYLLIELRNLSDVLLILLPLILSLLLTAAASVLLDLPFNFANVIVIPLLIGSGVEGAYLIYRFRNEPPADGNILNTSAARALFFSAFTTILSFSTLSFSSHRGMASMGKLLTICMGSLMISTLLLLPALLSLRRRAER